MSMLNPRMVTVCKRSVIRGCVTLLRERQWLTALGALLGVFVLVQLLGLVLIGLEGAQGMLRNRTDLRLEIQATANDVQVQEFYSALGQEAYVRDTVYVTKEKAYEQTKTSDPELISFLEEFNIQNPFHDTIGVTLNSLDDYAKFSTFVEQAQWQSVITPSFLSEITDQEKQVFALLSVTRAGRSIAMLILGVTGAALVFITTELIRRRSIGRSDEVMVERLVGASTLSIIIPFITEATILLLSAIIGSAVILSVLILAIPMFVPALQPNGALGSLSQEMIPLLTALLPTIFAIELICAPLIATIGAWLGMRRQIRSPRISFAI